MARIAVVFTGGTISMQPDEQAGGNRPVLDGAAILARAPQVAQLAQIDVFDWGLVPASHLHFEQLIDICALLDEQLARPEIDGAVVVQGTDSIEETAFAYQLMLRSDKPVVVTGAMRDAASPDYDGPANLVAAVVCAISPELTGRGVQVVLDGLVIAADEVVKTHSTALDTFQPRDGRPTGRVEHGQLFLRDGPVALMVRLPRIPAPPIRDVHLVTAVVGDDGTLVRLLAPLRPAGIVVAATGSGNTSEDLLMAAIELMAGGCTVALTTRCPHGMVEPAYAFPGGGVTWQRAGAFLSSYDGPKTRVAVALGLAAGMSRDHLAALLAGETVE